MHYFHAVITYYISSGLFALFGVKMLYEGYHMSATEGQEEFEEVNEELRKKEELGGSSLELGPARQHRATIVGFLGKIFIQSFTMTMLAEWGDRSQLATVILGRETILLGKGGGCSCFSVKLLLPEHTGSLRR
jgi:putative Ca2+/H+ antiporter (TMEM165/GDT1 family)